MSRKLIVGVPELTDADRKQIAEAADRNGFEAVFCTMREEALPDDAEIVFSGSPAFAKISRNLRWQCSVSAGVNQFKGIPVFEDGTAMLTNSSGAYGVTIAEHLVMMTLEMLRRQVEFAAAAARNEWIKPLPVKSIYESRVTFAGTGDIGCETAKRIRSFEPAAMYGVNRRGRNPENLFDRIYTQEQIGDVLPETDILIISMPGTDETFHMLDEKRLALLPDGALIVNVGRGFIIDEKALLPELESGRLAAALDVFETEPLPADNPLWNSPNLLILPHVAGNMTLAHTREKIVAQFLEDFDNYCAQKPLARLVDLKAGY
ncbi:MAG: D-2-hydroxyacid dehydrogenase [Eubacterium sp.]|nr:D-2-hydroxyacid dehydrogenase [Eubacterium sp.]